MLSLHTSPLAQPGTGDSGGMNVYVRELSASLAQAGVPTRVYVRRMDPDVAEVVEVEPYFEVVHIDAGDPLLSKDELRDVVDSFAEGVAADFEKRGTPSVIHANYWLSALAGHKLKHELGIPLVSTFHTLARVKAMMGVDEPEDRAEDEAIVIGCSDRVCASNDVEAAQLVNLYDADYDKIEIVAPGVDHAFFSPGDRFGARNALGLEEHPILLFVGRIQRLKGLDLAIESLAALENKQAELLVVGGPSGTDGIIELNRVQKLASDLGVTDRVRWVDPQPHHLLSTYYRAADVVLVPSLSESFGLVAAEAAACGTPVVASEVGGLKTLVRDKQTGYLIKSRDPLDWAEPIDRIIADDELAWLLRQGAAEIGRSYSWPIAAARLRRVYADVAMEASSLRISASCGG